MLCTLFKLVLGTATLVAAGNWDLQSGYGQDNFRNTQTSLDAAYTFQGSHWLYWTLGAGLDHVSGSELNGMPGGSRDVGSLSVGVQTGFGPVAVQAGTGLTDLTELASWSLKAKALANIPPVGGLSTRLELESSRSDDTWLGHGVRSSKGSLALCLNRWSTWAEAGGTYAVMSGGEDPGAPLPIQTPTNHVTTVYAWASREWIKGVMAGFSGVYNRGTADLHQPTEIVNDTAVWSDAPYSLPTEEEAISALLVLRGGKLTFQGNCPLWSNTRNRADDIWGQQPVRYYYWTRNTAPASASLGFQTVVGSWLLGTTLKAESRPYLPNAWFTDKAWNRYGLTLTLKH